MSLDGFGSFIIFLLLVGLIVGLPLGVSIGWFIWG